MDSKDLEAISNLLYGENNKKLKTEVSKIDNPLFLHVIAANYNWDDGFDIPTLIINNSNCDLGTALMMFYNADGYRLLESGAGYLSGSNDKWNKFTNGLYEKIQNSNFKSHSISYAPQISNVQVFKIRKSNPNIPSVFLEQSPGIEVDVPVL